jgi:hypothetical protein
MSRAEYDMPKVSFEAQASQLLNDSFFGWEPLPSPKYRGVLWRGGGGMTAADYILE